MAKKKKNDSKEKVVEVFDVEKDGKKKEIIKEVEVEKEHSKKEEIKNQQKQLRNILIVLGVIVLFFILIILGLKMVRTAHYEDVKFEVVQEGDLIFYNTKVPLYDKDMNHVADYNFYLRTEPSELKKVPLDGEFMLMKGYVLNVTEEFDCDGDAVIAFANLVNQYKVAKMVYINDSQAGCNAENKYLYLEVKSGDKTEIVQRENNSCYDIYVNNCEILKATEKVMAEGFVILDDIKIMIS